MPPKKTTKKTTTKKTVSAKAVEAKPNPPEPSPKPTVAPPLSPKVDVVETPVVSKEEELDSRYTTLLTTLSGLVSSVKGVQTEAKRLHKDTKRALKDANKKKRGSKKGGSDDPNKPKRAPSGFAKPAPISEELCSFLGVDQGSELARTAVTKHITQYIKEKNLQNPANKRHILPDESLGKLLNAGKDDEVTYFNLQKYMKHHFVKKVSA